MIKQEKNTTEHLDFSSYIFPQINTSIQLRKALYQKRKQIQNILFFKQVLHNPSANTYLKLLDPIHPFWDWMIKHNHISNEILEIPQVSDTTSMEEWVAHLFFLHNFPKPFHDECPLEFKPFLLDQQEMQEWIKKHLEAFELMHKVSPVLHEECQLLLKGIIPIKNTSNHNIDFTFSLSNRIGIVFFTKAKDSLIALDNLVHEFYHNRLNLLLEYNTIFKNYNPEKTFYSPWRKQPRPLLGILHGAFANMGIALFWKSYHEQYDSLHLKGNKDKILHGFLHLIISVQIGMKILQKHGSFNQEGERFIHEFSKQSNLLFDWACRTSANFVGKNYRLKLEEFKTWKQKHARQDEEWLDIF